MSVEREASGKTVLSLLKYALPEDASWRRRISSTLIGLSAAEAARGWVRKTRRELSHTVTLPGDDDIYGDVHRWLLENLPSKRRRALTARSARERNDELVSSDNTGSGRREREGVLRLFYDGSRTHNVMIRGHKVEVQVNRERLEGLGLLSSEDRRLTFLEKIIFTARSEQGRDAVLAFLEDVTRSKYEKANSSLYVARRYGDWSRSELPARSLDTIVLRAGQKEALEADLDEFLRSEDQYVHLGLPWHRGYLLHGPPGTGKTSLAKGLAHRFDLDVYYVPLSDLKADTNLLELVGRVSARSILVMEDIDVVHAAKTRDDSESEGVTLSGLLNALDGMATPHGLITIMTTNDRSVLDPALIRPGRADRIEELGYLDIDQLTRLVTMVTGREPSLRSGYELRPDATHAEALEGAKRHLWDGNIEKEFAMIGAVGA